MRKKKQDVSKYQITGQIIFRQNKQSIDHKDSIVPDDKKLMMFVGVVAVPKNTDIKGEHQYTIVGEEIKGLFKTSLEILNSSEINRKDQSQGLALGQLLEQPIWRI